MRKKVDTLRKRALAMHGGKTKRCLKCRKMFTSAGKGNRICDPCNEENDGIRCARGRTPDRTQRHAWTGRNEYEAGAHTAAG